MNCYIENNTWMFGNMKFISSVEHSISRVSKVNKRDILFNTRNNFIFPNIHVLFCLLYKKIVLLPHKNRAVYSNGFMIIDTCEIIDFISGGHVDKTLYSS